MDESPGGLKFALATAVKELIHGAGLTFKDVAEILDVSNAKVSRMLTGERPMRFADLHVLLVELGVDPVQRERLLEMCRRSRRASSLSGFKDLLSDDELLFYDAMLSAETVRDVGLAWFPLLLQTRAYHVALHDSWERGTGERNGELHDELSELIYDTSRSFRFVVDESVFARPVGREMPRQLEHLLDLAQRPNLDIRVHPFHAGLHPAAVQPFTILSWAASPPMLGQPLAHRLQVIRPGRMSGKVDAVSRLFDHLSAECPPPAALPEIIERSLAALARPKRLRSVVA